MTEQQFEQVWEIIDTNAKGFLEFLDLKNLLFAYEDWRFQKT